MISPVNGPITQRFGENPTYYQGVSGTNGHNGIDFGVPVGTTVVAPVNGIVVSYAYDRYNGNLMTFRSDSGYKYLFAHLSGNLVAPGTHVNQGQAIAKTGNTGDYTTGPHLHFGLYPPTPNTTNGFRGAIDPLPFIENVTAPQGGTDVIPDQDNWYYRMNKLMLQIRGRELSREEFRKNFVGIQPFRMVEILSDDAEANAAQDAQNVGKIAIKDNWQGQIGSLQQQINDLKVSNDAVVKSINDKVDELTKVVAIKDGVIADQTKQIESLKAQVGDTSKWETLKALIRELVGTNK